MDSKLLEESDVKVGMYQECVLERLRNMFFQRKEAF